MPTYQYACTECGHAFEQVQSFSDDALTTCPGCSGRLRKVFNAVGVVFKGSGFYRTDSRAGAGNGSGGNGSSSEGGSSSGSGSSGGDSGSSEKSSGGSSPQKSASQKSTGSSSTGSSSGSTSTAAAS